MAVYTNAGKQWTADKLRGAVTTTQQHIGWGTGTAAESAGNSALSAPSAEARVVGTMSSPSLGLYRVTGTITSASTQNITEVGLFDAATGGVMILRAVFTARLMEPGDSIAFTIDLTFA